MTRWGVYISGPGIVGRFLVCYGGAPPRWMIFDTESAATSEASSLQKVRPYHHVSVRKYEEGDEHRGEYASHPDGVT
jgi:hypothetical protein